MAPGVDVAQIDANTWAISIRGFNDRYANKVLVLIDGRTVYTHAQLRRLVGSAGRPALRYRPHRNYPRPGATVWGANAVNGVMNIISKSASRLGCRAQCGRGFQGGAGICSIRSKIGQRGTYRAFGNYSIR